MKIKPVKGRSVPDPACGDLLPESGRNVEESSYWLRRLADGDVEHVSTENKKAVADSRKQGGE